jgi:hypothetical protein
VPVVWMISSVIKDCRWSRGRVVQVMWEGGVASAIGCLAQQYSDTLILSEGLV